MIIKKVWGGPKEFLSLIRGAALICTDSFHGTMFSINFQRNFFSFVKAVIQRNHLKIPDYIVL